MKGWREVQHVLDAAENASPVDAVESVTRDLGRALGATRISLLIADLSGRALVRLAHVPLGQESRDDPGTGHEHEHEHEHHGDARESATVLPFDGGPREEAVRTQQVMVLPPGSDRDDAGTWTVLAPVTERGEPLGLLEMSLPSEPDEPAVAEIRGAAHLLGFVVIANRRHTDLYEWGQRTRPFTLSAEIQRRLLPPAFTCEAAAFTLSAWLEPAASIGGDTFDYSVARDVLHLSMTDAMGHGVASALTATLCVGALRGTRRSGESLLAQAAAANAALIEHAAGEDGESFVTGLIGRLDLTTGTLSLVNAGHVAPYLGRTGDVAAVDLPADLPLGIYPDVDYRSTDLALQPGDRLVLVTDGMVERIAGFTLTTAIAETRGLHAREAVRHLADTVLRLAGEELEDDATLLILDWHGDHAGERATTAGAQTPRAGTGRDH